MTRPRVLLVDDEPLALRSLEALLEHEPRVTVVGSTTDPRQALGAVRAGEVDILIVDIQMPGMSGIDLVQSLPAQRLPRVIFATAFDEYALEAFDASAIDYVLKPVRLERLTKALDRALESLEDRAANHALKRVLEALNVSPGVGMPAGMPASMQAGMQLAKTAQSDHAITVPIESGAVRLALADIRRIEAHGQRSLISTADGIQEVKRSLSELERSLDGAAFLRVHRSHIVAVSEIKQLERRDGGTGVLHLRGGESIPVSRNRFPGVRSQLGAS